MPSPTDFNLSPYFDDFSESKKFHRVLFRPTFICTGTRELTQSQTQLQNQIERFNDHIFKQGSIVIPILAFDLEYYAVKLTSISSSNTLTNLQQVHY